MSRHIREALRRAGLRQCDITVVMGGKHQKLLMGNKVVAITPYRPKHPDIAAQWLAKQLTAREA